MRDNKKSSMPLIGITPDTGKSATAASGKDGEPFLFLQQRYVQAILDAGGVPLILPVAPSQGAIRQLLRALDGVLVSGGNFDIHPRLYGEEPMAALGQVRKERTRFELELILLALERNLPLLGVCGGAQAINVALGGSLYQDIASQIPMAGKHQRGAMKTEGGHFVKICEGTMLKKIVGRDAIEVNTTHHQSVKSLGKGLIVNAKAEDGVVEGIESQRHPFVLGVQWHPESLAHKDIFQRKIFASFISACKERPA